MAISGVPQMDLASGERRAASAPRHLGDNRPHLEPRVRERGDDCWPSFRRDDPEARVAQDQRSSWSVVFSQIRFLLIKSGGRNL